MVTDPSKFQLMFLSKHQNTEKNMTFDRQTIKSSDRVQLSGITLDKNTTFKWHIENICHKANNKTRAIFHIREFLNIEQAQVLAEAYFYQILDTVY